MKSNEELLIESILAQVEMKYGEDISGDDLFSRWAFEQVLKDFADPTYEDLDFGDVDGSDDGGIDGFFTFLDGTHLKEVPALEECRKNPNLDVVIIQAKNQDGFKEGPFDKLSISLGRLFSLDLKADELEGHFSERLVERRELFKGTFLGLATKHPKISFRIVYASRGSTANVHPKVRGKGEYVGQTVLERFPGAQVEVDFVGAEELLAKANVSPSYTLELRYVEHLSGTSGDSYVLLARLEDYVAFVTTEQKELRRYLFDSNVRDYQGEVEVNKEIARTLESSEDDVDFWWLNNGVTILSSKASIASRKMMLDDVQIVNGLQTTETTFLHWKEGRPLKDQLILVKVIVTTDTATRDRVIKATNFQTRIPDASLRATDQIQRDIETFFKSHNLYYDRRKNYYKNQGIPSKKIVSIPLLAQAMAACVLREPHIARGKPASLIRRDEDYERIFRKSAPIPLYLRCVELLKLTDSFLSSHPLESRTNFRFHMLTLTSMLVCGKKEYGEADVMSASISVIELQSLDKAMQWLITTAYDYKTQRGGSLNTVSKSAEFSRKMIGEFPLDEIRDGGL
jgi:AIPR protein